MIIISIWSDSCFIVIGVFGVHLSNSLGKLSGSTGTTSLYATILYTSIPALFIATGYVSLYYNNVY